MAEPKPFRPVKLICGILASSDAAFEAAEARLADLGGEFDARSERFPFEATDYYQPEMGPGLRRSFVSFVQLIDPTALSGIKLRTNGLEEDVRKAFGGSGRLVNLDPGYLTPAALIMATAKDFSHRIPLGAGIYAHLELLFWKGGVRRLEWTYPDFRPSAYEPFFLEARRVYLRQLRERRPSSPPPSPGRASEIP